MVQTTPSPSLPRAANPKFPRQRAGRRSALGLDCKRETSYNSLPTSHFQDGGVAIILTIPFTPAEEARLSAAVRETGIEPAELIKRLALEHLPSPAQNVEDALDAKLRAWQQQDGKTLSPNVSAQALFAQWDVEDAQMTQAEREAEDRLWQDFEQGINATRAALGMRQL